jgi:hypothetical protein
MTAVSMHTFFNALLGIRGLSKIADSLTPAAFGLGLLGLAFLVFVAVRDRVRPLLMLLYLAALSIALWAVFPLNDPRIWLRPHAGPRYFLFACLFILLASLHLSRTAWPLRGIGLGLLGVAVCVGIPADFIQPRQPDVRWADNVAAFRSLPAGASFSIPVVPLFHPPLVLHKTTPQRGQPPLSRLRPLESQTPASYAVTRPAKVTLNDPSNTAWLNVAGWATDGTLSNPAGGVFVIVDDRAFPAVYGLPAALSADGDTCPDCGFSRLIPIDEIGPGPHQVTIAVVSRDGTGYYRPPAPRTFDARQFPPGRALPN